MKVHRVDYRLVPGLTHAMAGTLLSTQCSTAMIILPSTTGSAIDPDNRFRTHSIAQRMSLTLFSLFNPNGTLTRAIALTRHHRVNHGSLDSGSSYVSVIAGWLFSPLRLKNV